MIQNPFKLQNWKIKKFLMVILFFQLSLLGLFALNKLGMDTPIIRPLIGFIYLSFIPGYLLLRILKLHNLCSIESFLYALGLSLFMDMFVGFLMNMLYPILGITDKPISEITIVLTMAGTVFLLCIIAYLRDKNYNSPDFIDLKDILNPQVLFLSLIPFMAIFGTYLVNYYHNNILLMIMIVVIALVALIIGFTNWIDKKYYPYAIWTIAIALIFHVSLFTDYIRVSDIAGETYIAKTIVESSLWNFNMYSPYASVLSVTILPIITYHICKIDLTWIYKVMFPLFGSLIPVGLYFTYLKVTCSTKKSFLSSYIFIIIQPFFMQLTVITKQLISEIFLVLILIILLSKLSYFKKFILLVIFGASLIISHYGTAYLIMTMLIFTLIVLKLFNIIKRDNFKEWYLLFGFTIIYITLVLGWNLYISKSITFKVLVTTVNLAFHKLLIEFMSSKSSRGAYLLTKQLPLLGLLIKYLYMMITGFMFIGFVKRILAMFKSKELDFNKTVHLIFSLYWIIIIIASVVVPYFAVMDPRRLYHLAFFTLAPYVIMGGMLTFKKLPIFNKHSLKILYVMFMLFMLLNTGFVSELLKKPPYFRYLNQNTALEYGAPEDKAQCLMGNVFIQNIYGGKWLNTYKEKSKKIYRFNVIQASPSLTVYNNISPKEVSYITLFEFVPTDDNHVIDSINRSVNNIHENNNYIYIDYANIKYNLGWGWYNQLKIIIPFNISEISPILHKNFNKIYDNGGSQIFLSD